MTTILLALLSISFCQAQNNFLFKKEQKSIHHEPRFRNQASNTTHFYRDLQEQVDSAHLREYNSLLNAWTISNTAYFTYTNEHRLAVEKYLDYSEENEIYQGYQDEYFYNEFGLWNLHYSSEWDENTGLWNLAYREESFYNEDLLPAEFIFSYWDETLDDFEYESKSISSYTPSQKTEEVISYSWDGDAWQQDTKTSYEYNTADSISLINYYTWIVNSGSWEKHYYQQYFYTDDTRLDSVLEFQDAGNGLEPYSRTLLEYNAQGLPETETGFDWESTAWVPDWQDRYAYTPGGLLALDTYYEWDEDEQTFIEDYQEENIYTPANDPYTTTYLEFDADSNAFIPSERYLIAYDENVDGSTIVWPNAPNYESVTYHKKPIYGVTYYFDFNQWYEVDTTIIYYGGLVSSTNPVTAFRGNFYPNPAQNQVNIDMENLDPGATIHFYDQQGKFVYQSPLRANCPISVSRLVPGAYVYRIHNGKEWLSGKLVKE